METTPSSKWLSSSSSAYTASSSSSADGADQSHVSIRRPRFVTQTPRSNRLASISSNATSALSSAVSTPEVLHHSPTSSELKKVIPLPLLERSEKGTERIALKIWRAINALENEADEILQSLPPLLNESVQDYPCHQPEDYQTLIVLLKSLQHQLQPLVHRSHSALHLSVLLDNHLKSIVDAVNDRYGNSPDVLPGNLWSLYLRILDLPTLEVDSLGSALVAIKSRLDILYEQNPVVSLLKQLFASLKRPEEYLKQQLALADWNSLRLQPCLSHEHPAFTLLMKAKEDWSCLLGRAQESPEGQIKELIEPIQSITATFQTFSDKLLLSRPETRMRLLSQRAYITGLGLGFFTIDQEIARRLLCRGPDGRVCKENADGNHPVVCMGDVFYKPNPEGTDFIAPQIEIAVHSLYQRFGDQGTAPTTLIKIHGVLFGERVEPYGRVLQAGFGIKSITLQDFLWMLRTHQILQGCLGVKRLNDDFVYLLNWDWMAGFFDEYPDLKAERLAGCSEKEVAQFLLPVIKILAGAVPLDLGQTEDKCILTLSSLVHSRSRDYLVKVLAMLRQYPQLAFVHAKQGPRPALFEELLTLPHHLKKINQLFPALTPQQILEELPLLASRFDSKNFGIHVIASILANPSDHKGDNLMAVFERDAAGRIISVKIVGIDNDQVFAQSIETTPGSPIHFAGVRSILYLLDAMNMPIHEDVRKLFRDVPAATRILGLLADLEEVNQRYKCMQDQGVLVKDDLWEGGAPSIAIPLRIPADLISNMYGKAKKIEGLLPRVGTYSNLFVAMEPELATAYQAASQQAEEPIEALLKIYRHSIEELVGGICLPQLEKKEQSLVLPSEAAAEFLLQLNFASFPLTTQVALFGKMQEAFPAQASSFPLPGTADKPDSRREFFLHAVTQGQHALTARLLEEEKKECIGRLKQKKTDSLISLKNREGASALLVACGRLDIEMVRLLLHYGATPEDHDLIKRNALILSLGLFPTAPTRVAALIHLLGEHPRILFNRADETGYTALHYLVKSSAFCTHIAQPLMTYMIQKGADPDLVDFNGETALDKAIKAAHEPVVEHLISLGAGKNLNADTALTFFKSRNHLSTAFKHLVNTSLRLRWHLSCDAWRQSSSSSSAPYGILEGTQIGCATISAKLASQMLDEKGYVLAANSYGRRRVVPVEVEGYSFHVKQFPEMPGTEFCVGSLLMSLNVPGAPYTDLVRMRHPSSGTSPVLLSQTIQGDNLQDVLTDSEKRNLLKLLDSQAFSKLFFASLLLNLEDGKPDNAILEQLPNGLYRIIFIDSDHAFVDPLVKSKLGVTIVQVKNILFCLDQMRQPINPIARAHFLACDPEHLLRNWLAGLVIKNEQFSQLFSDKDCEELLKKQNVLIPIVLKEGLVSELYQKLIRLQAALRKSEKITHMEVLRLVIPALGTYYEEAYHVGRTPLERFHFIAAGQYKQGRKGHYETVISSREILKSSSIPTKAALSFRARFSPARALEEFEQLQQEIDSSVVQLSAIRNKLQVGDTSAFRCLRLDGTKQRIVNGALGQFEGLNFRTIPPKQQKKVLHAIAEANYIQLRLSHCDVLDRKTLMMILKASPDLYSLTLDGCQLITAEMLNELSRAKYLTKLTLSNLSIQGSCRIELPALKELHLVDCHILEHAFLGCPQLKKLQVKSCWQLSSIQFADPYTVLQTFSIEDCRLLGANTSMAEGVILASGTTFHTPGFQIADTSELITTIRCSQTPQQLIQDYCANASFASNDPIAIDLSKSSIADEDLLFLIQHFPNTASIKLQMCKQITDKGLGHIAEHCSNLTAIDLTDCWNISLTGIFAIVSRCELKVLNVSGTNILSSRLPNPRLRQLTSLNISHTAMGSAGVNWIPRCCPNVTSLDISYPGLEYYECDVIELAELSHLTRINMANARGDAVTRKSVTALLEKCQNLTYLNVRDASGHLIDYLLEMRRRYRKIEFEDDSSNILIEMRKLYPVTEFDGDDVLDLIDSGSESPFLSIVQRFPNTASIKLQQCKEVSDNDLLCIGEHCSSLTAIDLTACMKVTLTGISAIASRCQLKTLNLSYLSVASQRLAGLGLSQLTSLNISHTFMGSAGVNWIPQYCPNLTSLDISHPMMEYYECDVIDLAKLSHLSRINMANGVRAVTRKSVTALLEKCQNLTYLNVRQSLIFANDLLEMRGRYPMIEFEDDDTKK